MEGFVKATILTLALSVGFLLLSLSAIRRQRLHGKQAVLWLFVSLSMVFMSATLPLHILDHVSLALGIAYPPELILLLGVLFLFFLVFQLSTTAARLAETNTALVQEIGLLKTRLPDEVLANSSISDGDVDHYLAEPG